MTITSEPRVYGYIDPDALVASAAGPDSILDDPHPLAAASPQVSLLTSATDVTGVLQATYGDHWLNGFIFEPEVGALNLATNYPYWWYAPEAGGATAAATSPSGVKQIPSKPSNIANRPLIAHTADPSISTMGLYGRDYEGRATRLLQANLSRIIENELWTGLRSTSAAFAAAGPPISNDFLTNAPTILNAGVAAGFVNAITDLEQAYFDLDNRPGVIHAQPRLVSAWYRSYQIIASPTGRQFRTALGTLVVPGTGYTGAQTAGGAAGTRLTSFAFITGPVCYALTPIELQNLDYIGTGAGQDPRAGMIDFDRDGGTGTQDRNTRAECYFSVFWDSKVKVGINVNSTVELG